MLSDKEFDLKWKQIAEQHEARQEFANAWRDHEVARLFETCGWDQVKIAAHVKKSQTWVSFRLVFGRFLTFITRVMNAELIDGLTEGRFRRYWSKTAGTELERFEAVAHVLREGIPHGYAAQLNKPGVRDSVVEVMKDGEWYTTQQITASIEEKLVGITIDQVFSAVRLIRYNPPKGRKVESRQTGKRCQYRLVNRDEDQSPVAVIFERAAPLLDELEHESRKHMAEWSPSTVRKIAVQLRRLFEEVLSEV